MRRIATFLMLGLTAFAGDLSYVVLNGGGGLVRVSEDGRSIQPIAMHLGRDGHGLAIDRNGDYIVTTVSQLLRVSRQGDVHVIAAAPPGSQFMKVAVDAQGNFIVCDNMQHAVWRVEPDGVAKLLVRYPAPRRVKEDVELVIDADGDYLLIAENGPTAFYKITPGGQISRIPLRGDPIPRGGNIIADGAGGYIVGALPNQLYRLTPGGESIHFFNLSPECVVMSMVRNPRTYEVIITAAHKAGSGSGKPALFRASPDGSTLELLAVNDQYLSTPTAIVVDTAK